MGIVLGFWDLRHTHPRIRSPRLHLYASPPPQALFTLPGIFRSHKLRYYGSGGASKNNCDANRMHMRTQLTRCQASSVYVLSHWPLDMLCCREWSSGYGPMTPLAQRSQISRGNFWVTSAGRQSQLGQVTGTTQGQDVRGAGGESISVPMRCCGTDSSVASCPPSNTPIR